MNKLFFAMLIPFFLVACDNKDAPFGLKWSSDIDQFPSKNLLTFNKIKLSEQEGMVYVTTVPKEELGRGSYRFYFNHEKLYRIVFNTYDLSDDVAGSKAKNEYDRIKSILTERYGHPVNVTERVYSEAFRFVPCVTNSNCGSWSSSFSMKNTSAKISIGMGLNEDGYKKTSNSSRVMVEFKPN